MSTVSKVIIDYDGVLSEIEAQTYARELVKRGVEVWMITTRYDDDHIHLLEGVVEDINQDVYDVCNKVGIPAERRIFTNMKWKYQYMEEDFVWILDDNRSELIKITKAGLFTRGILYKSPGWRDECESLL